MSKIKKNLVDLSVSLRRFRISPLDKKFRGDIWFSPSTRCFCVMSVLHDYDLKYPIVLPYGCLWSKCVCESITCSKCDYNISIL